ncbi:MAG TPA: type II toxin-antitoxin system RelE/ParE family toxin [Pyrinomonadaceae bacterium]
MAYRVEWSPRALEDLEAIAEYISSDSPAYAASVVKTILRTTRNLSRFPFAGRTVPEFDDQNIREWFAYSYRIIYRVEETIVTVATVVHGKRLLSEVTPPVTPSGGS